MPRLIGGTRFLLLTRQPEKSHRVDIRERFEDVLTHWTCSSRVSPVFPIDSTPVPNFADGKRRWLLFAGPMFPGDINPEEFPNVFLSLGLFNVIVFSDVEADAERAVDFAKRSSVQWEQWTLDGHYLVDVNYSATTDSTIPADILTPVSGLSDSLKPTVREYAVLIGTAVGRAATYAQSVQSDLMRFDKLFRALLCRTDLDEVAKQGQLVIANAMLSRHTSQTYAGVSPILETECHFWTHSLLGIGIASLALVRLRQFVEKVFTDSRLNARLRALKSIPATKKPLLQLSGTDEYWDTEHLFRPEIEAVLLNDKEPDSVLPLVTCYSGRDGFRSTKLSLSAPLEVITNGNTVAWTPLTITHEISHTIIDGALGILLPRPDSPDALKKAINLIDDSARAVNICDQLEHFLCHHLWHIHSFRKNKNETDSTRSDNISADDLAKIIREEWADLNETLTHVFDFLYFYQRDPALYVPSLWASWGVIPNIQSRVPAYIVRTLCAVHATNLRTAQGMDHSIDQVTEQLKITQEKHPNKLIETALLGLENQRDIYLKELLYRVPFIKLVRGFLFQPRIAQSLFREAMLAGGDREGYNLKPPEFSDAMISNPIRFVTAYTTKETASNELRAAWILYHLAFGE